jgi:hypothetical protein
MPAPGTAPRPPYGAALLVGAVVLGVYLLTLAPTTAFWDTSEYIAAAKVLGIPHPPGNPLFVLLAHAWGFLPLAADYAVRINLFAAVTSATAAGLWFLVAERWMRDIVEERWARLAAAGAGVLVSATMWTVWNQSTVNEKVYTLAVLTMALVTWLAVHWADDRAGPHRDRWLILIAYIIALSSTNHLMGVLAAPAVAIYVLRTDWRVLTRGRVLAGIALAVVVGISVNYLFLPIRAAQLPPINEGEPVGFFSQALLELLGRAQYQKPPVTERQAAVGSQLLNYLQYFSWQFARDWGRLARPAAVIFGAVGLWGLAELVRRDRRAGLAALAMFATLTVALVWYLNFKYGFSIHPERTDLPREVRERDYFFIGSFAYFGVLVAVGFGALMRAVAEVAGDGTPRWPAGAPVLALALVPLVGNAGSASRAHETAARATAFDLLDSVEPYGILITAGDNDTFPLWYAQEVEGFRRDVTIANLSLMNTRWHLRQLRRRETPVFDPAGANPLWRGREWPRPAGPVFSSTEAELDTLPEMIEVQQGAGLQLDSLALRFGQPVLFLPDVAVLLLIRDNLGHRPIYFSWSASDYPDRTWGLTSYLATGGLVRRLEPVAIMPGDSLILSEGLGYMDLPRTRALLDSYRWREIARPRRYGWVDIPSQTMPNLYSIIYGTSAATFLARGDTAAALRADSVATAIERSTRPFGRPTLDGPPPAPPR